MTKFFLLRSEHIYLLNAKETPYQDFITFFQLQCVANPNISSIPELSAGTGAGCFAEGSVVHTESGPKPVELLRPGERVLAVGDDGKVLFSEVRLLNRTLALAVVTA